mmetsp:Transcript_56037/g.149500  ORF Transcript_56037/g.149500 Transcript_56037/m.149500 type:complete len:201 (+) Transcript_56037:304-906(+)
MAVSHTARLRVGFRKGQVAAHRSNHHHSHRAVSHSVALERLLRLPPPVSDRGYMRADFRKGLAHPCIQRIRSRLFRTSRRHTRSSVTIWSERCRRRPHIMLTSPCRTQWCTKLRRLWRCQRYTPSRGRCPYPTLCIRMSTYQCRGQSSRPSMCHTRTPLSNLWNAFKRYHRYIMWSTRYRCLRCRFRRWWSQCTNRTLRQ